MFTFPEYDEASMVAHMQAVRSTSQAEVDAVAKAKAQSDATAAEHMDYTHHVEYGAAAH